MLYSVTDHQQILPVFPEYIDSKDTAGAGSPQPLAPLTDASSCGSAFEGPWNDTANKMATQVYTLV